MTSAKGVFLRRMRAGLLGAALAALGLAAVPAGASTVFSSGTQTNSSGHDYSASATFELSGSTLTVTLVNTSGQDYSASKPEPIDVLCGLFFDLGSGATVTSYDGALPSGMVNNGITTYSDLRLGTQPGGWDYAYNSAGTGTPGGQHFGVGTAGFGFFAGSTSSGGPGGPFNFGIVNAKYVDGQGNGQLPSSPFVQSTLTFTFTVNGVDEANIGNVYFQYGTGYNEPGTPGTPTPPVPAPPVVPTPSAAVVGFALLAGLGVVRFCRRRSSDL